MRVFIEIMFSAWYISFIPAFIGALFAVYKQKLSYCIYGLVASPIWFFIVMLIYFACCFKLMLL